MTKGHSSSSFGRFFVSFEHSEQLSRLFQQLKDEILNSSDSMEVLFHLVQELSNAAEKYFFLKKLFWKVKSNVTYFHFLSSGSGSEGP